jgi:hypothetical protein
MTWHETGKNSKSKNGGDVLGTDFPIGDPASGRSEDIK